MVKHNGVGWSGEGNILRRKGWGKQLWSRLRKRIKSFQQKILLIVIRRILRIFHIASICSAVEFDWRTAAIMNIVKSANLGSEKLMRIVGESGSLPSSPPPTPPNRTRVAFALSLRPWYSRCYHLIKQHHIKNLLSSFHLKGHDSQTQTQTFEPSVLHHNIQQYSKELFNGVILNGYLTDTETLTNRPYLTGKE